MGSGDAPLTVVPFRCPAGAGIPAPLGLIEGHMQLLLLRLTAAIPYPSDWGNVMIGRVVRLSSRFVLALPFVLLSFSASTQNTASPLPPPGSASLTDSANVPEGAFGLYKCENKGDVILCLCVLTKTSSGSKDLNVGNLAGPRLIDDLHDEHRLLRAYFINGRGQHQPTINVTKDDSVWFGLEFE